ncbi:MAG: phosphatase PAP2 family protein [Candidatus Saccharimonadales bacterium]
MTQELLIHLIADGAVIPVFLIGAYVLLFKIPKGHRWESYARIIMAALTAYLFARFIGTIYQPEALRPFQIAGTEAGALYLNNPGFPSDHALFVTVITAAVWFETRMKKTTLVLVGLVILICIGRVIAGVHTPLDVIGGVVIALVGSLWYFNKTGGQKVKKHGKSTR